jgi:hypothetical protein
MKQSRTVVAFLFVGLLFPSSRRVPTEERTTSTTIRWLSGHQASVRIASEPTAGTRRPAILATADAGIA